LLGQKRYQSDADLNSRLAKVLSPTGTFDSTRWQDIRVGDVVRLETDDFIPADLILLSSSEPEGFCYIETSNLDGCAQHRTHLYLTCDLFLLSETNLKIKQASPQTSDLTSPNPVIALRGSLRSEHPNNSLYTYEGSLDLITSTGFPKQVPLGPDQMLLRGAQLRNTPWAYGLVVFTGHETKLMRNAT
jgi:phospholipid-transporting ATPase